MPATTQMDPKQRTIKNPKSNSAPNQKTAGMNDRDFVNDILANEKYLTDSFNVFVREASHSDLHEDVKNVLDETHCKARKLFNVMFEEGHYKLTAAKEQEVKKTKDQFTKYLNDQKPY